MRFGFDRVLLLAVTVSTASAAQAPVPTAADVRFMQGMIGHHTQAVVMSHLVPARTRTATLRLMAERIDVSQRDEIALMSRWLGARGAAVPVVDTAAPTDHGAVAGQGMAGHDMGKPAMGAHDLMMPGMLSPEQLARLAAAKGATFDRLFLTFMIQHHEGALVMVRELLKARANGQDPALYEFASDIDATQRAEIARMRKLLASRTRRSRT